MSLAMTRQEREAFLAGLHVGVLSVAAAGRSPLTVPVWYAYEPGGDVWFATEPGSRKGRLVGVAGRASLCAQNEVPPYSYVSVEGAVRDTVPSSPDELRLLAHRYLGPELGDAYLAATSADAVSHTYRLTPEVWWTVDYAKMALG